MTHPLTRVIGSHLFTVHFLNVFHVYNWFRHIYPPTLVFPLPILRLLEVNCYLLTLQLPYTFVRKKLSM